jgi:hypothetical protein
MSEAPSEEPVGPERPAEPTKRVGRLMRVGLIAAIAMYVGFAMLHALGIQAYKPGDEERHVQYVVALEKHGRLPTMKETRGATHPPLYYALVAKTTMRGVKTPKEAIPFVPRTRVMSAAFGIVALLYVFGIVRRLVPSYPAVAVHATALTAALPSFANNCAVVGNDAMGLATQLGMTYAALVVLHDGPSWKRLAHVGFWLAVGGLVRISAIAMIPGVLLAVLGGFYFHASHDRRRRVLVGAVAAVALVALVAVTSGWFYLGNRKRLGDVAGTEAILEKVRNNPVRPLYAVIFSGGTWLEVHDELWGKLAGNIRLGGALGSLARIFTTASLVGVALSLWRAKVWRAWRPWRSWLRSPGRFQWLAVACLVVSVILPTLHYHSKGGGLHQRYFFGILYVWTILLACAGLFTRARLASLASIALALLLMFVDHFTYASILVGKVKHFPFSALLENRQVAHPQLIAGAISALVAAGFVGVVYSVMLLHRPLRRVEPAAESSE